jgi:DNA-binding MarR family transcriptional regulator
MKHLRDSLTAQTGLLSELMTGITQPLLESMGMTLAGFELLSVVKAGGGSLPQAELARRLGVSAPTLCEAVKTASHRGLLVQNAHPTDSRAKTLTLTARGARIVNEVLKKVNQAEAEMVIGIGDKELNSTIDVLRRINRNLAKALTESQRTDFVNSPNTSGAAP